MRKVDKQSFSVSVNEEYKDFCMHQKEDGTTRIISSTGYMDIPTEALWRLVDKMLCRKLDWDDSKY